VLRAVSSFELVVVTAAAFAAATLATALLGILLYDALEERFGRRVAFVLAAAISVVLLFVATALALQAGLL
jgi:hypothetical protein